MLALEGRELSTVEQKKLTFKVATNGRIDVMAEDGKHEPIRIYRRELNTGQLTNAGVSKGPSYVAGIIQTLVERNSLP